MARRRGHTRTVVMPSESDLMTKWKKAAGCEIWAFAKRACPIRKLTGKYLYIDSESLINELIVEGIVPNAALWKSANVPMNRRVPAKPHAVMVYGKWRTVKTGSKLVPSLGVPLRPVEYYGGYTIGKRGFFGLKRDVPTAFGLTNEGDKAMPAYSQSVVEWLCDENMSEVQRILRETFDSVMKRRKAYS